MKTFRVFFLLFIIFFLKACFKEPQSPSWDTSVSAPLLKTSLGIHSLITDSLIHTDSASFVYLVYKNLLYQFAPDSLLKKPDTVSHVIYKIPFNAYFPPGQEIINKSEEKVYSFGKSQISTILLKKGLLKFNVSNTLEEAIKLNYHIPSATKNGTSLKFAALIPAAQNGGLNYTSTVDISGYKLNMKGASGLSTNTLNTHINAFINPSGDSTRITIHDKFQFTVQFEKLEMAFIKGFFEPVDINAKDATPVELFDLITSGSINFEQIQADILIENGYGVDLKLKINDISSYNERTQNEVALNAPILGQTINLIRATETGQKQKPVIPSYYFIDFSETNIKNMFENLPDKFYFDIEGQTNPMGNISGGNDFYYNGFGLNVFLNLNIPLSIKAHDLTLSENFDFSLNKNNSNSHITHGNFNLITDNGFPFDAEVQLYLYDADNTLHDSLMFNNLIAAAPLNQNNIAESSTKSIIDVPIPPQKMEKLYETHTIRIQIKFNTNHADYIKLYDFYKMDLQLTGDFNLFVTH